MAPKLPTRFTLVNLTTFSGIACASLGLTIMLAWHTHHIELFQVSRNWVPMVYNTALGFFLSGMGLLTFVSRHFKACRACGWIVAVIGLLSLFQYIFHIDVGIDQLFVNHYNTTGMTSPGRPAPNTAFSLAISGLSLWLLGLPGRGREMEISLPLFLGMAIVALGSVATAGYATGVESAYGWGNWTRMAPSTAVGFFVLGTGTCGAALTAIFSQGKQVSPFAVSAPILVFGVIVSFLFCQALAVNRRKGIENEINLILSNSKEVIQTAVDTRTKALARMAGRLGHNHDMSKKEWEFDARSQFDYLTGVKTIVRLDPSLNFLWGVSKGNSAENVNGLLFNLREAFAPFLGNPIDSENVQVSRRVELPDRAGPGFYVLAPIFQENRLNGFMLGIFQIRGMLNPILWSSRKYFLSIRRGEGPGITFPYSFEGPAKKWRKETKLNFLGESWRLAVWPGDRQLGKMKNNVPEIVLAGGILSSLLLFWAVFFGKQSWDRLGDLSLINRDLYVEIEERKRAEKELEGYREELEEKVRERTSALEMSNKDLEAFSYSVSHNLRKPLRHVAGFGNLLKKNCSRHLDEEGLRYIGIITASVDEMSQMIDGLLNFSRVGRIELKKKRIDLGELVQETIRSFQDENKDRKIVWEIGSLPEVYCDPPLLKLVLVNLISNAVKFTRHREEARIRIESVDSDGSEHVFCVRDNGVGFDMNYRDKLFNVFQRLHLPEDFEGTGIGLANVRRILQRHEGRAWAEGFEGKGASFYFSLPKGDGYEN